jgi:hypothetical protein
VYHVALDVADDTRDCVRGVPRLEGNVSHEPFRSPDDESQAVMMIALGKGECMLESLVAPLLIFRKSQHLHPTLTTLRYANLPLPLSHSPILHHGTHFSVHGDGQELALTKTFLEDERLLPHFWDTSLEHNY